MTMTNEQAEQLAALILVYYEAYTSDLPHPEKLTVAELLSDLANSTNRAGEYEKAVFDLFA